MWKAVEVFKVKILGKYKKNEVNVGWLVCEAKPVLRNDYGNAKKYAER